MKKSLILLGHISLLVTAILAVVFYKERVFYVDPGQQLFYMINEGWFRIFVNRYSMVINQVIPLLAIKAGLPLQSIVISYSLSFVVVYYTCFLISVYGFKNIPAGLSIAFAPIFIRMAFGHSISEAWLGIAYSAVFYAILNYYPTWKKRGIFFIGLFYFSILLIILINYFIHPSTLFMLGFAIGFTYFKKKEYRSGYIYIISFLVLILYLNKFIFPTHVHDESFFEGIRKAPELLPAITGLPLLLFFKKYFFTIYFPGILLLMIASVFYLRERKIKAYLFSIGFIVFYFIIACLAFYKGDAYFALESRLIPLAFMVTILFVEIMKDQQRKFAILGLLIMVMGFSFTHLVYVVKKEHSSRIDTYETLLATSIQYPERKFYIYYPGDHCPVNSWGSAVETLMLSSLKGKENSRTIVFISDQTDIREGLEFWPCVFIWVPWFQYLPEERINKKYFDLGCTPYRELSYKADQNK